MAAVAHPTDLRLVAFLASAHGADGDPFRDPSRARAWCTAHALDPGRRGPSPDELARLRALRAALRAAIDAPASAAARRLGGLARHARLTVVAGATGPSVVPEGSGFDAVVGRLLLDAVGAADRGTWGRVRVCGARTCDRVFLDTSRGANRTWCDMATCGNRAKVHAHRARARSGGVA